MLRHSTQVRVRYAETDQMGYVYYGRYAEYFEIARAELVRELGLPYRDLETDYGIMLPVRELHINYLKPALYDDLLTLTSEIKEWPSVRITFTHEITNSENAKIATGKVILIFVNKANGRPCKAPQVFLEALSSKWING